MLGHFRPCAWPHISTRSGATPGGRVGDRVGAQIGGYRVWRAYRVITVCNRNVGTRSKSELFRRVQSATDAECPGACRLPQSAGPALYASGPRGARRSVHFPQSCVAVLLAPPRPSVRPVSLSAILDWSPPCSLCGDGTQRARQRWQEGGPGRNGGAQRPPRGALRCAAGRRPLRGCYAFSAGRLTVARRGAWAPNGVQRWI
jgi:hypothetical protein